jgi:hypothetical protein
MPSSVSGFRKLREFDISDNNISGALPLELFDLDSLRILILKGNRIVGFIPTEVARLVGLQVLYLQYNSFEGNLPISMSTMSTLQVVDISNNRMSGVLPFFPSFKIIGADLNLNLSIPVEIIEISTTVESPTETQTQSLQTVNREEGKVGNGSTPLVIGVMAGALALIFIFMAVSIHFRRRKQGKETEMELRLLPKYSSRNKKIRLLCMINRGGFGVVWKARYLGEIVAIKLIRMEKYEGDQSTSSERNVQVAKMVVDEASIMKLMVHERIVRFIIFEVESLGIVLEYLPLGSLYEYIRISKGVIPWTDRYQLMLDICEGMEFLHSSLYADGSKKLVLFHQDLKSGNVLLSMEGNVLRGKISDFGLSCKSTLPLTNYSSLERQSAKQK